MVTDSASNILKTLRELTVVDDNVRCIGHVINNAVKEAFDKCGKLQSLIVRCKNIATCTHKSSRTCDLIKHYCEITKTKYIKVIQPVKTRWNSMADCMTSIVRLRKALEELKDRADRSDKFVKKMVKAIPSSDQFDSLQSLAPHLQHIKSISERLTSDKKPTIHLVIPTLVLLSRRASDNPSVMAFYDIFKQYLEKTLENCGRTEETLAIAAFLHPHYKGSVLYYKAGPEPEPSSSKGKGKSGISKTKKKVGSSKRPSQKDVLEEDDEDAEDTQASQLRPEQVIRAAYEKDIYQAIKERVVELMRESRVARGVHAEDEEPSADVEASNQPNIDLNDALTDWSSVGDFLAEGNLLSFAEPKASGGPEDDLDQQVEAYLNRLPQMSSADGDILAYWRSHEGTVPDLARLARRILATPASSASSERLFSAAGKTISDQRTNLSSTRAEQLLFIQQNYNAVKDQIFRWDLGLPKETKKKGQGRSSSPTPGPSSASTAGPSASPPTFEDDEEEDCFLFDENETSDPDFGSSGSDLDLVPSDEDPEYSD